MLVEPYNLSSFLLINRQPITLAQPVLANGSTPIGVVHSTVDLVSLKPFVANYSKGGHTAFITDKQGKIIAHPDNTFMTKDLAQESFFKQAQEKDQDAYITTYNGQKVIVFSRFSKASQWYYFDFIPYSELTAIGNKIITSTAVLVLIFIVISIIGGYIVSGFSTRTIKKIMDGVSKISQGDLTVQINVKDRTEFGQLASGFNQMGESLRTVLQEVNETATQLAASSEELTASAQQTSLSTEAIATSMQQMATGTDQQVRSVEESAKTVNQMAGEIQQIATSSLQVADESRKASDH
jgi:methyl-accepting chemotaxis protein